MAGHSKWANIKHRKEKADAQKGKIFSRIAKEIISAVKLGGSDPKGNARLRLAILKAREANMPTDNIDRNIKKASSPDQADFVSMTYELYGHGGIGLIVEVMTDNKNRTASDMRIATNKRGGTIATPGAVAFNFDRRGILQVSKQAAQEEALFQLALDAGAEDFEVAEDSYVILTDPVNLYAVKEKIDEKGIKTENVDIVMLPKATVECDDETQKANTALIDWIEELDDVNAVYHNMRL